MATAVTTRRPRTPRPTEDRFWEKVIRHDGECWEWTDKPDKDGYGLMGVGSRAQGTLRYERAHRLSWIIHNGPIPDGLWVLHHCDNPPCTNPEHLYLGTVVENGRDRRVRKRTATLHRTHCSRGHEFTEANTYYEGPSLTRRCRRCHTENSMASYYRTGRDRRLARKNKGDGQ